MNLRETLSRHNIGPAELGRALTQQGGRNAGRPFGISAMSLLINHGKFPAATPEEAIKKQIEGYLEGRGIPLAEIEGLWAVAATAAQGEENTTSVEDTDMLPRKSGLSLQARKHFKLMNSPLGDVERDEDMFLSPNIRYAREALMGAMRNGGFLAMVGESGAGKTTLIVECEEQIRRNALPVTLIRPPIIGMDIDSDKGAPLKARNILNFIMDVIDPSAKRQANLTGFAWGVQRALAERHAQGQRFALVIDDAHRLHKFTMNHLKDFYEIKSGRARLLSIILMGQPALANRLDPLNPDVVQITQRCELLTLSPLGDDLQAYLEARFTAAGLTLAGVFAPDAVDALRARLATTQSAGGRRQVAVDLTYPLAVNNLVTACMNLAAELGVPQVNGDVVREA